MSILKRNMSFVFILVLATILSSFLTVEKNNVSLSSLEDSDNKNYFWYNEIGQFMEFNPKTSCEGKETIFQPLYFNLSQEYKTYQVSLQGRVEKRIISNGVVLKKESEKYRVLFSPYNNLKGKKSTQAGDLLTLGQYEVIESVDDLYWLGERRPSDESEFWAGYGYNMDVDEEKRVQLHSCRINGKLGKYVKLFVTVNGKTQSVYINNSPVLKPENIVEEKEEKIYVCSETLTGFEGDPKDGAKNYPNKKYFKKGDVLSLVNEDPIKRNPGWGTRLVELLRVKDSDDNKYWMNTAFLSKDKSCSGVVTSAAVKENPVSAVSSPPQAPSPAAPKKAKVQSESASSEYVIKDGVKSFFNLESEEESNVRIIDGVPVRRGFGGKYVCANNYITGYKNKADVRNRKKKYVKRRAVKIPAGESVKIIQGSGTASYLGYIRINYKGRSLRVSENHIKDYADCPKIHKEKAEQKYVCGSNVNYRNDSLSNVIGKSSSDEEDKVYLFKKHKFKKQEKKTGGVKYTYLPVVKKIGSDKVYWVPSKFLKDACEEGSSLESAHNHEEKPGSNKVRTFEYNGEKFKMNMSDRFPLAISPMSQYLVDPVAKFGAGRQSGRRTHAATDLYTANRAHRASQKARCSLKSSKKYCKHRRVYAVADGVVSYKDYFYSGTFNVIIKHGKYSVNYGELVNPSHLKLRSRVKKGDLLGITKQITGGKYATPGMLHFEKYEKRVNDYRRTSGQKSKRKYKRHYSLSKGVSCYVDWLHHKKFGHSIQKSRDWKKYWREFFWNYKRGTKKKVYHKYKEDTSCKKLYKKYKLL